ncbi:MAG: hypothetical protein JXR40_06095 [Pontiellaceae bacterium]|nr:hypothetical protein [Pontiellaceae bacterium]
MKRWVWVVVIAALLSGCQLFRGVGQLSPDVPAAEQYSRGYYPVDPMPIQMTAPPEYAELADNALILSALPDETMRLAIGSYTASGGITYGPAAASYSKGEYVVILDYTKCTTIPVYALADENGQVTILDADSRSEAGVVPVYAGVGLRLKANITVEKGSVNLGSLMALGAAVDAENASGSLVVQTLGISGESVSNLLPMPSEISVSTIQNCIVALGSIKAKMYEEDTQITPRIVGFNTSMANDGKMTRSFVNQLMNCKTKLPLVSPIDWSDGDEEEWDDE